MKFKRSDEIVKTITVYENQLPQREVSEKVTK